MLFTVNVLQLDDDRIAAVRTCFSDIDSVDGYFALTPLRPKPAACADACQLVSPTAGTFGVSKGDSNPTF